MIDDRALIALIILAAILVIVGADALFNGSERRRPSPLSDEALGDADWRTTELFNRLSHFGTDTRKG